jgi:hypothetical protein
MRSEAGRSAVHDVLLFPEDDRPCRDAVVADVAKQDQPERSRLAGKVKVIDWHDVARGLRRSLADWSEAVDWLVFARVYCGAIEQTRIGLPALARHIFEHGIQRSRWPMMWR